MLRVIYLISAIIFFTCVTATNSLAQSSTSDDTGRPPNVFKEANIRYGLILVQLSCSFASTGTNGGAPYCGGKCPTGEMCLTRTVSVPNGTRNVETEVCACFTIPQASLIDSWSTAPTGSSTTVYSP